MYVSQGPIAGAKDPTELLPPGMTPPARPEESPPPPKKKKAEDLQ